MGKRRNVKKVDYSKFAASGPSSDSEDDFQEASSPKPKKPKDLEKKKSSSTKSKQPVKDSLIKETKRRSRTSNADQLYEKDLMTAIECSKNVGTAPLPVAKCGKSDNEVILLSESDSEGDVANNMTGKRNTRSVVLSDSYDSSIPDTVPYIHNTPPISNQLGIRSSDTVPYIHNKPPISNQLGTRSSPLTEHKPNTGNISTTKTLQKEQSEDVTHVKRTPKLSCNDHPSLSNTPKHLTPGRLRLGLSRNIRITKPLHTCVNIVYK